MASFGSRMGCAVALGVCTLCADLAHARSPLPTIEVVEPRRRRVGLHDIRGPVQLGYGYSLADRAPVVAPAFSVELSFFELSRTTALHVAIGESIAVPLHDPWGRRRAVLGLDGGIGLSRHAPDGPALIATVAGGPRWENRVDDTRFEREDLRADGWGAVVRVDGYPFYRSMSEIRERPELGFVRRYVLSGVHVFVAGRYDVFARRRGPSYVAGVGLDLARTLLMPIRQRRR